MRDPYRFDPLGWFMSACVTVLFGAIALAVAVHLIQAIWVWLLLLAGIVAALAVAGSLALWWQRRRPW